MAAEGAPGTAFETYRLSPADLDGDGDLDVVVGGEYSNAVWDNQRRHLAWRSLPGLARPLDLDVSGPPGTLYLMAYARDATVLPYAKLGLLRLEPSTLRVHVAGTLDAEGRGTVTIPPLPLPLGSAVYWQAAVGSPLRFTNLEVSVHGAF